MRDNAQSVFKRGYRLMTKISTNLEGLVDNLQNNHEETVELFKEQFNANRGYNPATGDVELNCANEEALPTTVAGEGAVDAIVDIRRIESWEDIRKTVSTGARASFGKGVFKAVINYSSDLQDFQSEYKLFIVISVDILLGVYEYKRPTLDSKIKLKKIVPIDFLRSYGSRFSHKYQLGSRLYGILEVTTQSKEQRKTIAKSLATSGTLGKISLGASVNKIDTLLEVTKGAEMHFRTDQFGGPIVSPSTSLEGFLGAAITFSENTAKENARNRVLHFMPYSNMLGMKMDYYGKVLELVQAQGKAADSLGSQYERLLEHKRILDLVRKYPDRFSENDRDVYHNLEDRLTSELRDVRGEYDKLVNNPEHRVSKLELDWLPTTPVNEAPPQAPPAEPITHPVVQYYSGPTFSGRQWTQNSYGVEDRHPVSANCTQIESIRITGDFQVNSWWIRFLAKDRSIIQDFYSSCEVPAIGKLDLQTDATYRVLHMVRGQTVEIKTDGGLKSARYFQFVKNPGRDKMPPRFDPLKTFEH